MEFQDSPSQVDVEMHHPKINCGWPINHSLVLTFGRSDCENDVNVTSVSNRTTSKETYETEGT